MGDWSIDGMGQSQFWVASKQGMRLNAAVGNQWDSHAFPNSCDGILGSESQLQLLIRELVSLVFVNQAG